MPIYEITDTELLPIARTSFSRVGVKERTHLQQLLKQQIGVISPDTLIISEEFGD